MNALAQSIEVKPRQVDFGFDENLDTYFFDNDAFKTSLIAALSSVFPEGERFFIRSVRNYQDQIKDPVLRQQIRGFIGQEAHHGKQHEEINELFEKLGYEVKLFDRMTKRDMQTLGRILPKAHQLAVTTGLEHFTAILANYTLEHPELFDAGDNVFQELIAWHAIEETEHKAVAYDVYQAVSGNYYARIFTMLSVTFGFFANIIAIQCSFLWRDYKKGRRFTWGHFKDAMHFFWNKNGPFRSIWPEYKDYFRRDFHPWDHDNRAVVADWKEKIDQYVLA